MDQSSIYKPKSVFDMAAAVRDRRERLGWTQEDLARNIGTSRKWVSGMEQGKPSVELFLILKAMDSVGLEIELHVKEQEGGQRAKEIKIGQDPQRISRRRTGGLVRGKKRSDNV